MMDVEDMNKFWLTLRRCAATVGATG